jgi:hypothetical protein
LGANKERQIDRSEARPDRRILSSYPATGKNMATSKIGVGYSLA